MKDRKITFYSEAAYFTALIILTLSVAMAAAADFGLSMIAAPAYILSRRIGFLTFGQCDYLVEFVLLIVFCIVMKRVKVLYLSAFVTSLIYGGLLDLWRIVIPALNPKVTAPGSMPMPVRIIMLAASMLMLGFAVALIFRSYFYPQIYDLFVKGLSEKFGWNRTTVKRIYDACSLVLAVALSLLFFGKLVGIGVGTLLMTFFNGIIIGFMGKMLDARFEFPPLFPGLAAHFSITE